MTNQEQLIKLLGLKDDAHWCEIYAEIGRLKAVKNETQYVPYPSFESPNQKGLPKTGCDPYYYVTC